MPIFEFHVSRRARNRYQFAETLFSFNGNVVFSSLSACREFAHRMNLVRDADRHPEQRVHPAALYAMGLIDEASHVLIAHYRKQFDPLVMTEGLAWLAERFQEDKVEKLLLAFVEHYPGLRVYRGEQTPRQWLAGSTDGVPHRDVAFEEMVLLWMANRNPAFQPFNELFDDTPLAEHTIYRQAAQSLPEYFATRPLIPLPDAQPMDLLRLLLVPALTAPGSLRDQLAVIRKRWGILLGPAIDRLLMIATEVLHEEELAIWTQFNPAWDPARLAAERRRQGHRWGGPISQSEVPHFEGVRDVEYEKFSPDVEWMPRTVLMAKSTYVWLNQLSRWYGRVIDRLNQIPDEELDALARRGFTALWLIGLWERSRASKTIKQLCGNSDAVASAYSLFDYRIADDLGGEAAYNQLRDRAAHRGIRLASDMVANHMGIDSPWVVEHPDWFLSRWDSPYPNYSFDGPDLSADGRVEIQIERHYYDQSDAAVVFRRRDRASGEVRYIYHGNDGTSFPWNDTAQLDYLNPAVREHLIQTILHVARMFPVIRFDAAMTLAKRHFHRLWFPGPGSSGAIPSRAEYGLTDEEFNRAMPHEFWREVVDRVAAEVPGTLLLAEAFWLMEGYFVRTLGMHRVYNSAFMNMLRDEDNAKYRSVIKNTIEFDPDILKRYVNFMSNPDERTAIDQFGSGDKCFGVATLMATLPGLPMFGHGQLEGFTEKYGMEYRRPRYEENPNGWLVERHERQIAPLLHRRSLFAESGNFLLYDFYQPDGQVNEDVFAYSNRRGHETALVIYHNRYAETEGTVHMSAAYADKGSGQLRRQSLQEGLGFGAGHGLLLRYRDASTGLEYLRWAGEVAQQGFRIRLQAYEYHVLLDFQELRASADQPWDRLCEVLNGEGVPNLEEALLHLELQPAHEALREVLDAPVVRYLADLAAQATPSGDARAAAKARAARKEAFTSLWQLVRNFLDEAQEAYRTQLQRKNPETPTVSAKKAPQPAAPQPEWTDPATLEAAFRDSFTAMLRLPAAEALFPQPWSPEARSILPSYSPEVMAASLWAPVLAWRLLAFFVESLSTGAPQPPGPGAVEVFDQLRFRHPLAKAFHGIGLESEDGWRSAALVREALAAEPATPAKRQLGLTHAQWADPELRWLLGWNEWQGHSYVDKESYEELLWWLQMPRLCRLSGRKATDRRAAAEIDSIIRAASEGMADLKYCVDTLLQPAAAMDLSEPSVPAPDKTPDAPPSGGRTTASPAVPPKRRSRNKAVDRSRKTTKKKTVK